MNEPLLQGFLDMVQRATVNNMKLFDARVERDGPEQTMEDWVGHVEHLFDLLLVESQRLGAPTSRTTLELTLALCTSVMLDLASKDAAISIQDDGQFTIYSEGAPWMEGSVDTSKP